jgi:hypothetical protein
MVLGNSVFSKAIQFAEKLTVKGNSYSHCGMCIRADDFPKDSIYYREDTIYILEALTFVSDGVAPVPGTPTTGVQLRPLDDVIHANNHVNGVSLAWMPLIDDHRPVVSSDKLLEICNKYLGASYDYNPYTLLASAFRFLRCLPILSWLLKYKYNGREPQFCSKVLADVLQDCGTLSESIKTSYILPMDFVPSPYDPSRTYDSDSEIPVIYLNPVPIVLQ